MEARNKGRFVRKSVVSTCVALAMFALPSAANAFFIIIPIPHIKTPPSKIDATAEQRKLAMCAAVHKGAVDTDIDGKRKDSWRGDVISSALGKMSGYGDAKKLTGAYLWEWTRMQKQNFESGQAYAKLMIEACSDAQLPVERVQYDYWKSRNPNAPIETMSVGDIPAQPLNLDGLITSADFPESVSSSGQSYTASVALQIDREGKVADCFVEEKSGSQDIDDATCDLLMQRAQFRPAVEAGFVAVSEYVHRQYWPAR